MQSFLQAVVVLQRNHDDMFPTLTGDHRRFVILAHRIQSLLKAGSRLTKSQDIHLFSLACYPVRAQAFYVHAPDRNGQSGVFAVPSLMGTTSSEGVTRLIAYAFLLPKGRP
ncbi:hypothetical protein WS97_00560 [Burkholderia territorii]|nr:hypothetical protein WS97_00560 [Burkholderia territorii]